MIALNFFNIFFCSVKLSLVDNFWVQKMCLYISQLLAIHVYAIYLKNALLICLGGGFTWVMG